MAHGCRLNLLTHTHIDTSETNRSRCRFFFANYNFFLQIAKYRVMVAVEPPRVSSSWDACVVLMLIFALCPSGLHFVSASVCVDEVIHAVSVENMMLRYYRVVRLLFVDNSASMQMMEVLVCAKNNLDPGRRQCCWC